MLPIEGRMKMRILGLTAALALCCATRLRGKNRQAGFRPHSGGVDGGPACPAAEGGRNRLRAGHRRMARHGLCSQKRSDPGGACGLGGSQYQARQRFRSRSGLYQSTMRGLEDGPLPTCCLPRLRLRRMIASLPSKRRSCRFRSCRACRDMVVLNSMRVNMILLANGVSRSICSRSSRAWRWAMSTASRD